MKHSLEKSTTALKIVSTLLLGATFVIGCAAQAPTADKQLKDMEKKIMQLKAENSHLNAKTKQLDDKVLIYEKKKSLTDKERAEAKLRTVRLSPGNTGHTSGPVPVAESIVSMRQGHDEVANKKVDKDESRPVLRLSESSFAEYDVNAIPTTTRVSALPTTSFENIPMTNRGENLGVVAADGQLARAEADSMELFNSAYRAYNNKDYGAALAGFSTFLQKESNHKFADNAMFWIAECWLVKGKLFKAVGEFERLLRRYPSSEKSASSLYRIGFIYDRMQDSSKAKEYYFRVVDKYPNTEAARKASRRMSGNKGNARLVRTSAKR